MRSTSIPPPPVGISAGPDHEVRFRELFDSQFRPLLSYALRRVRSPEDAADVVAETMLVAWRRIGEVPSDETARLWLYGVAHHVIANHRRGQRRRDNLADRLRQQLVEVTPDHADLSDSTAVVREGLATLSDDDRELLMLTAWDGLQPREAAVVLGVPARTIRTRLHRARTRLRKTVGDVFGDHGHVRDEQTPQPVQEER